MDPPLKPLHRTPIYWIDGPWPGRLAIVPRPRGGDWLEDEVQHWQRAGLDGIVSLLTSDENADLDLSREAETCASQHIAFLSFPIPDREVPASRKLALEFIKELELALSDGKHVALHCRQGIGRSALMVAALLVLAGNSPETALERISLARGCAVPETAEQRAWVTAFAREFAPSVAKK